MTLDDLLEVFNKGLSAKLATEDYPRESFGAPTLNRAGIAAVVRALEPFIAETARDTLCSSADRAYGEHLKFAAWITKEILGDAGEKATTDAIQSKGEENDRCVSEGLSPTQPGRSSIAQQVEGSSDSAAYDNQRVSTNTGNILGKNEAGRGGNVGGEVNHSLNEKVAGGPRPEAMGSTPPATDPAPAVCVWRANKYEGAYSPGCETPAVWYSDGGETPQKEGYNFCPSCGKPIRFVEAKT